MQPLYDIYKRVLADVDVIVKGADIIGDFRQQAGKNIPLHQPPHNGTQTI